MNIDPSAAPPQIVSTNTQLVTQFIIDVTNSTLLPGHTNFGFSCIDRASNLQNFSEFTALFDYYRLAKVTRKFIPVYGPGASNQAGYVHDSLVPGADNTTFQGGYAVPTLMMTRDRDSNEPITSAQSIEMPGVKRHRMSSTFTHSYAPVPSMPVGSTTSGPSVFAVVPKRAPWLTTDGVGASVDHYGARYGVLDWPGPNNLIGVEGDAVPCCWRVYTTYHIQCKGLR